MGFTVTETIERPAAAVWSALTDWRNASRWMGTGDLAPTTNGAVGVGTRLSFESRGQTHESEISRFEPGKSITLRSKQRGITAVYEYRLESRGPATEVQLTANCWGTGLLWKLAAPLIGIAMKRADSGQLAALKRVVEEG